MRNRLFTRKEYKDLAIRIKVVIEIIFNFSLDVRQSLYDETNVWLKAVKARGGKFLGGNKPNLADLSVYGALSAIEGCEAFLDLCANTKVKSWYDDVQKSVENSEGQIILSKT